jgi:hypothetical protein
MKNAIVTYNWSNTSYEEAFNKVVVPRLQFLAKKWGAELIISNYFHEEIRNENWPNDYELNQYNKSFILKDVVKKFDRTLCVDADMVLSRETPNVFEIFPQKYFYAVLDGAEGDKYCFNRVEEMIASQAMLGNINWTYGYYNVGLMLLDKMHAKIFEDQNYKIFLRYSDQTKINYFLQKYKFAHKNLSRQFNSMAINSIESTISPHAVTLVSPDVLAKNTYAAHAAAIPSDIRNDYIFKLDILMK